MSEVEEKPSSLTGIEKFVAEDIGARQQVGIKKYGTTVDGNPLPLAEWLRHAYEESLDLPIYLRRAIEEESEKDAEIKKWKRRFATFAIIHCAKYGEEFHGKGKLDATHYDLLEEAGARLIDFERVPEFEPEITNA